jgi:primosomal protein N' (replication factor Y)
MRIADVAFDVPVPHPFSYRVPDDMTVAPGQRVRAPLHGGQRVGLVLALRDSDAANLKPIGAVVERAPVLSEAQLDLAQWIAAQSLSTLGSTALALLPPPGAVSPDVSDGATREKPLLLVGHGRERRLIERITASTAPTLVLVPDIEAAARWAARLGKVARLVRLDSGADDDERADAWGALAGGRARIAVGTRSALLTPLPPGAWIALIDEHEAAHKPPGAPRIHTRDVVMERARRESLALALTSATPSVESWWRADSRRMELDAAPAAPWPSVSVADTRGILRREPITPPLARAMRDALAAGQRVFLGVSRRTAALACDECGSIVRCEQCGLALVHARAATTLSCRLCGSTVPMPDVCPTCQGRRLSPFGWSPERVEHAVRRRFPKASVARYDPDGTRGAKAEAQRKAAAHAEVVVGTRGALRLFGPSAFGVAGFVTADHLFRVPDFRAGERAFAAMWAAAERVRPDGALVIQSQAPEHYALRALVAQDLDTFYREEMKFRGELGYPPFRRLAIITVIGKSPSDVDPLTLRASKALCGAPSLTVYPPTADRRGKSRRIVVKGGDDLPIILEAALGEFRRVRAGSRGIMDVEVDPVEWPF